MGPGRRVRSLQVPPPQVVGSGIATALALFAAFLFALAAVLQQKGALNLSEISLARPKSMLALLGQRWWLAGTAVLLCGYVSQAAALDRGRLVVIQPLLVTTVVFALPLGYFLTGQTVGTREVLGAAVIVAGLALFVIFGDPAGGRDDAPNSEWLVAVLVIAAICGVLAFLGRGGNASVRAGVYGTMAGVLFGLSAALTKPVVEALHVSVSDVLTDWMLYALAIAGGLGFLVQQLSLATGKLAPSVATVSVANPVVSLLLGVILLEERLARPGWHVLLAIVGLGLALLGAVAITVKRETAATETSPAPAT